jgi:hypothetical protein
MESKYYLSIRPQTNDLHAVHRECCPFMPDDGKKLFLGEFESAGEAVKAGNILFGGASQCLFCCKEKPSAENRILSRVHTQINSNRANSEDYLQVMLCCVN